MRSIFVYVYLEKPQTTLKSFIYECSSVVRICCFIWKQIIEDHAPFLLLSYG